MSSRFGGIPLDQPTGSKFGGVPLDESEEKDTFVDDALDVAGEFAAGANRSLMWIPDTVLKAANYIPGVNAPTVSEAVGAVTGYVPGEGGYMDPGLAREAVSAGGEVLAPGAMGMTSVSGRNVARIPDAIAEFMGLGMAKTPAAPIAAATDEVRARIPKGQGPRRLPAPPEEKFARLGKHPERELAVRRNSSEIDRAGYKLGADGKAAKDAAQQRALKSGIDEGIVAQVASGTPADKKTMRNALDIVERGLKDKTYRDFNSPRLALGDSLMDRYQFVERVNKDAGKALKAAKTRMKSIPADDEVLTRINDGPVRSFMESLEDAGVEVKRSGEIFFKGSDFEDSKEAQDVIASLVERMRDRDFSTAHDLHRFKNYIDERTTYGQSVKGLKGRSVGMMKSLRHDISNILNEAYPDYGQANKTYSDTVTLLDELSDLVGKKNNISDKSLGRVARQSLSNAQRAERVEDALLGIDDVARKYGGEFADDPKTQASFVQSLEQMFKVRPPASIGGEFDKSLMLDAASGNKASLVEKMLSKGWDKVTGKSDQELINVLRELANG